ncbi:MAG: emp24/gp25L/p24 family protein [Candidatus Bathyarchaeota archaeon]|nr:emp24/gp25L/p24 family protein [Candidatus Bathyarchaeota archaeon]
MNTKKTAGIILTVIGIVALVYGAIAYTSTTTQTETKTIPVSEDLTVTLELGQGDKVQGAVTLLNGNEGISVKVENPANETVYNGGAVYSAVEFSFNAQTSGSYTATFHNLSSDNGQTIEYSFTYPTTPILVSYANFAVGALLVAAGVILVALNRK